jgi:hypothetical protein
MYEGSAVSLLSLKASVYLLYRAPESVSVLLLLSASRCRYLPFSQLGNLFCLYFFEKSTAKTPAPSKNSRPRPLLVPQ